MGLTGDFASLARMRAKLANAPRVPALTAETGAPRLVELTREAVQGQTTLGGRAISDVAATYRRGTRESLQRTGAMLASLEQVVDGATVGVRFGIAYARFALRGFFPKQTPRNWVEVLRAEAQKHFQETI
jgi:hypothetical protein